MLTNDHDLPRVSVIVPVKNGAQKIAGLLDSLMQVDYDKEMLEIVVVDGNSSDNTREIVLRYPTVKLLTEERPGLNAARNTGIKNSAGEVIAFTDSDCIVSKNWVRKIVEDFGEKEVGCVGGNALRFYDDLISRYCDESLMPVMRIFTEKKALSEVKPPVQYPAGCNMAIRRSILAEAGEFDENIEYGFDEDELVERICSTGHTMVLDPDLLVSHKHRSSVRELLKQTFRYGRGMGVLLREKGLKSIFSKWILLIIFGLILWTALLSSLSILAVLTGSLGFLYVFSGLLVFPFVSLALFYVYRTVVYRDRKWKRIFAYPLMDVSRFVVFVFGSVYQLVKSYRKRRNQ
ncbi:hypothetical protein A3K79_01740 [Candidatus Bathyarchaeota archaeon RBG_13_46_16b]|nr:MAG: hypothetical protein A3K79_01740 [Candidatus Bathyarchaeota archaeon RBG_13_46_16b]